MKPRLLSSLTARLSTFLMSTLLLLMVSGCGGGNGSGGTPLGPGGKGTIDLAFLNNNSVIPQGGAGVLSAMVSDASGNPAPSTLVKFVITTNTTAGTFSPPDGFALTDNSGVAQISVLAGVPNQSGEITATANVNVKGVLTAVTGTIGFTSSN